MILLLLLFAGAAGRAEGRVVSQSPYITDTLRSLGLENRIAGVSRYDDLDLPKTGGVIDPDPAAIAALHPDYLFVSDWGGPDLCKRVTPPGAKCVMLYGFKSMSEIGGNIRAICDALGIEGGDEKAAAFERQWREAAAQVNGGGRRALILSSCEGSPFSFGVNTYLHELFTAAGFQIRGLSRHPPCRSDGADRHCLGAGRGEEAGDRVRASERWLRMPRADSRRQLPDRAAQWPAFRVAIAKNS